MEVTDDAVRMLLEVIRRIATQTEKHLRKALLQDIKRVAGKMQILFRVAEAVIEVPDGTIRTVLFPRVKEETCRELVAESKANGPQYRVWYHSVMRQKFARHYRRMLPLVLDHFSFRSANRFQPVIDALAVLRRYQGTRDQYLPEAVPVEGVVPLSWRDTVLEVHPDGTVRTNRQYYELCVLQQLERALQCKEVWVEGSYAFRNPTPGSSAWPSPISATRLMSSCMCANIISPWRRSATPTPLWSIWSWRDVIHSCGATVRPAPPMANTSRAGARIW